MDYQQPYYGSPTMYGAAPPSIRPYYPPAGYVKMASSIRRLLYWFWIPLAFMSMALWVLADWTLWLGPLIVTLISVVFGVAAVSNPKWGALVAWAIILLLYAIAIVYQLVWGGISMTLGLLPGICIPNTFESQCESSTDCDSPNDSVCYWGSCISSSDQPPFECYTNEDCSVQPDVTCFLDLSSVGQLIEGSTRYAGITITLAVLLLIVNLLLTVVVFVWVCRTGPAPCCPLDNPGENQALIPPEAKSQPQALRSESTSLPPAYVDNGDPTSATFPSPQIEIEPPRLPDVLASPVGFRHVEAVSAPPANPGYAEPGQDSLAFISRRIFFWLWTPLALMSLIYWFLAHWTLWLGPLLATLLGLLLGGAATFPRQPKRPVIIAWTAFSIAYTSSLCWQFTWALNVSPGSDWNSVAQCMPTEFSENCNAQHLCWSVDRPVCYWGLCIPENATLRCNATTSDCEENSMVCMIPLPNNVADHSLGRTFKAMSLTITSAFLLVNLLLVVSSLLWNLRTGSKPYCPRNRGPV